MENKQIKNTIFSFDDDNLFLDDEILYFKNGELWGIKNNVTGELKLFHCKRLNFNDYAIGTKIYNRIYGIWLRGTDERVNYLMNNNYVWNDSINENEYYCMRFNSNLLKRGGKYDEKIF